MKVGCSATKLLDSAKLYSAKWKSEDAMSWMSIKSLFDNRLHMLRATTLWRNPWIISVCVIALWMLFSKQGGCREQGINFPLHTLDL